MNESCWPTLTSCLLSLNGFPPSMLLQHFILGEAVQESGVRRSTVWKHTLENPAHHLDRRNYSQIAPDKRTKSPTPGLWKWRLKLLMTSKGAGSLSQNMDFKHHFQVKTLTIIQKQPSPAAGPRLLQFVSH